MPIGIEFEPAAAQQIKVRALAIRRRKIVAAHAKRDDPVDLRMAGRRIDPGAAMHAVIELHPVRVIVDMDHSHRTGDGFQRLGDQQRRHVMEIAGPHETETRLMPSPPGQPVDAALQPGQRVIAPP